MKHLIKQTCAIVGLIVCVNISRSSANEVKLCDDESCLADGGFTFIYDSVAGTMATENGLDENGDGKIVTVLEITSREPIFEGFTQDECDSGLIENLQPTKYFKLTPRGFGSLHCGPIVRKGLSGNWLASQLRIDGSMLGGGAIDGPLTLFVETDGNPRFDFDADGRFDPEDIGHLLRSIRRNDHDARMDVNEDGQLSFDDLDAWIKQVVGTWYGDANLDGEFNSADLVQVFRAAEYEDDRLGNSNWTEGDWNGDYDFTSADLTKAFQDGGYEKGRRVVSFAVPESCHSTLLWILSCLVVFRGMQEKRTRERKSGEHKLLAAL